MTDLDSIEKLTEFFNQPVNKEWIEFCKQDLNIFYGIQLKPHLLMMTSVRDMLNELDLMIKGGLIDKKEWYDFIRHEVLIGTKAVQKCKESLSYLEETKYLSTKKLYEIKNKITLTENILLDFTKKFANDGVFYV